MKSEEMRVLLSHSRGLPHVAFRRNYMSQLCALLPLPAVLPIEGGSPDPTCSSLPCVVDCSDVVCASPRPSICTICHWRPIWVMESPVIIAPRLTVQDPLAAAGGGGARLPPSVVAGGDERYCYGSGGDSVLDYGQ